MNFNRRDALKSLLFGAGGVGLRALATGIPASFLLNPKRALAQNCMTQSKAQYFIISSSAAGDPINAGAPGTFSDPAIQHPTDPTMAETALTLGTVTTSAAKPWAGLAQNVLDRTVFWHMMTNTPVHPKQPDVMRLMGATPDREMLPSLLAKAMAPCFGTVQAKPISIGGASPTEALSYDGSPQPIIPPLALKAMLTAPSGPLATLQATRDATMNTIYGFYKSGAATPAEKSFIDQMVNTQSQARLLSQTLLNKLSSITSSTDPVTAQITAAVTLIQMNIAPVIMIHIPFGGDNHGDPQLKNETAQTVSGVGHIGELMAALADPSVNLQDQVSFATLNVFGRTLAINGSVNNPATDGRAHNPNHLVSVTIGKPFKGGVMGSVAPVQPNDYGCTSIDPTTGAGGTSGIAPADTLGSYAQTLLQAVGADTSGVTTGQVVQAALV